MSECIQIGQFEIHVQSEDQLLVSKIETMYQEFLCSSSSYKAPDLIVNIKFTQLIESEDLVSYQKDRLVVKLMNLEIQLDFEARSAAILVSGEKPERQVDTALRYMIAFLAARVGGFLFHGAGIIHEGHGYIFFGPSGSGKTTVSRLSVNDKLMNDDLLLILPDHGRWWVYSTPFTNPGQAKPEQSRCPLKAMFRLVQDKQVNLERISSAIAVGEVIANIPVVTTDQSILQDLVPVSQQILAHVPVFRLHFLPDPSFWIQIDEFFTVKL